MTPEQRTIIEEAVGRRISYPPGALVWAALRKVLEELLTEEDHRAERKAYWDDAHARGLR